MFCLDGRGNRKFNAEKESNVSENGESSNASKANADNSGSASLSLRSTADSGEDGAQKR